MAVVYNVDSDELRSEFQYEYVTPVPGTTSDDYHIYDGEGLSLDATSFSIIFEPDVDDFGIIR